MVIKYINNNLWSATIILITIMVASPLIAIILSALSHFDIAIWQHLLAYKVTTYLSNTLTLIIGVGLLSIIFGVSSAWVVARYDFWGKKYLEWMLLLPLAMPSYIIAYSYTDFFEYAGAFQQTLRYIFDWQSAQDYYFPNIRSHGGAIIVMSAALYPYIYLLSRTAFRATAHNLFEVTRLHHGNAFLHVALPTARPAIIAGLALISMEVMADFGTVDYFAIETISLAVYNIWLGMGDLTSATQIAIFAVALILALIWVEQYSRRHQNFNSRWHYHHQKQYQHILATSWQQKLICWLICFIPIFLGFILPSIILISLIYKQTNTQSLELLFHATGNSLLIALYATCAILLVSIIMVIIQHYRGNHIIKKMVRFATIGYGFPGTILAIGVLTITSGIDNMLTMVTNQPISIIGGSVMILIIAYMARFLAIGHSALHHAVGALPANLIHAGALLGHNFSYNLFKIILPLLKTAMLTGGLLVFVDIMKELPLSLLLRPFGMDSLAVITYQYASNEMLDMAALPALMIVVFGLIPVIITNKLMR